MGPVKCFLLEPTDRVRQKLRCYSRSRWDEAAQRTVYDDPCPLTGNYHNAEVPIEDADPIWRTDEAWGDKRVLANGSRLDDADPIHDDPRWPTACACGQYAFTTDDRQVFCELIYRRADTGEEMTLRDAPPGAMWYADWLDQFHRPQLEHNLVVKLPDGTDWQVDSQATNCTMKDDWKQERHHCWVLQGEPPNVTAGKDGPTCGAGAGSIQSHAYHGFLTDGWIELYRGEHLQMAQSAG